MPRLDAGTRPSSDELERLERALPSQPTHLAVALAGDRQPRGWWGPGRPAGWADAIEATRVAARSVDLALDVEAAAVLPWHPGRCAALLVGGRIVGHAGELHPRIVEAMDLPARTCAAEIDLLAVLDAAPELVPAPPMSSYPPATLDVAVVVEETVAAATVALALTEGAGPLLESLQLFDVYTGPPLSSGEKSLAFALRLRAGERTLTAEEAVAVRDAAVAEAARRCGATLRGA